MPIERILLAQINPCVGDLGGNLLRIRKVLESARSQGDQLVVFPEMTVTGYPPEDLLLKGGFVREAEQQTRSLARHTRGLMAVVGSVERDRRGALYNTAFAFINGKLSGRYHKMCLPNYGVFDEKRYFSPGLKPLVLRYQGERIAVSICEDVWLANGAYARAFKRGGADWIVNLSGSPYQMDKHAIRQASIRPFVKKKGVPLAYTNLVGGQDELVFDGQSFVMDGSGRVLSRAKAFEEDWFRVSKQAGRWAAPSSQTPDQTEEVWRALVLGTRDYVEKNHFSKVLIGLSGGIDSALVACIAVRALGNDRVVGVTMPSSITSSETLADARALAANLGILLYELPIAPMVREYEAALKSAFAGKAPDAAEENIQARVRGTLLMALSNKMGWLVLTTGNKSEVATGYCTLYGDMAGGFAVIKDVPKTLVYRLSRYANGLQQPGPIPESVILRAPTAELRINQKDQDTLPPYEALDRFIEKYIDEDSPVSRAAGRAGMALQEALRVSRMIDLNEYKRRQAPPGIKITSKAFGRDRRMPITNRYKR